MKRSIIALSVLAIPALALPLLTQPEKKSSATEKLRTTVETPSLRIVAPPSPPSVEGPAVAVALATQRLNKDMTIRDIKIVPAVAVAPSRPSAPKNLRIRTTGH